MHPAVNLFLKEMRLSYERMFIPVLKDEIAALMQDSTSENPFWDSLQALKGVGGISEHKVKFLLAERKEIEDIVPDHGKI